MLRADRSLIRVQPVNELYQLVRRRGQHTVIVGPEFGTKPAKDRLVETLRVLLSVFRMRVECKR